MGVKTLMVRERLGGGAANNSTVCHFWKRGKCNRNPCRFMHTESPAPNVYRRNPKQSPAEIEDYWRKGSRYSLKDQERMKPYHRSKRVLAITFQSSGFEDENTWKSFCRPTEDLTRKHPVADNLSVLTSGGSAIQDRRPQGSINCVNKDLQGKEPNPLKLLVLNNVDAALVVRSTHKSSSHESDETCEKKIRLHHESPGYMPANSLVLTTGSTAPEDKAFQESQEKACEHSLTTSLVLTTGSTAPKDKTFQESQEEACEHSLTNSLVPTTGSSMSEDKATKKSPQNVCDSWMSGNCVKGDECQFLHPQFHGDWFFDLAKLAGHKQAVSGIALPSRSDKLYSSSHDGTVQVWDCHTGQSTRTINLGDKIGSLISKGPWVFVGMPNMVKAWNIETAIDFSLVGPVGQVYAMVVAVETEMLFAAAQDGVISAWKGRSGDPNPFQMAASLRGHKGAVLCLAVKSGRIFSGSLDGTIRVWDLDSLQCIHMLTGHTNSVTSLIFWNQYLLSCSLDHTIKVWVGTGEGSMEVTYSHEEKHGALALCGINDAEGKPALLCSCNNNVVCLYELPSFKERQNIFGARSENDANRSWWSFLHWRWNWHADCVEIG